MVDFRFFADRSFSGANIVAFIVSFAMLAMFFFLALYMQDVLGLSPLQTGLRFLPATVLIMITGPIAGRMADRVGPRSLMTLGMVSVAFSLFWMTGITTHSTYGFLLVSFLALGLGMGLVMSPMSTAAMNAVDQSKAGVASGILSMTRMVGGTFGVAVVGALVATLARGRIAMLLPHASAATRTALVDALGSGSGAGHGAVASAVQVATDRTFVYSLSHALYFTSALALLGAVLAWVLVAPRSALQRAQAQRAQAPAPARAGAPPAPAGGRSPIDGRPLALDGQPKVEVLQASADAPPVRERSR